LDAQAGHYEAKKRNDLHPASLSPHKSQEPASTMTSMLVASPRILFGGS
jgi:hypothetical protein